jgi:hypothetical protein
VGIRPSESLAQQIIEAVDAGSHLVYREDQSQRMHDFDVFIDQARTGAVEVTSIADETSLSLHAAIDRHRFVPRTLCKEDWRIHLEPTAKIKKIKKKVDAYLAAIEGAGLSRFVGPRDASRIPAVASIWRDLHVHAGSVFSWKTPGIGIALPIGGGAYGPAAALTAVRTVEDNREKLANSGALEHHLAVYVDHSAPTVRIALQEHEPPAQFLELPTEITCVWMFTEFSGSDRYVAWRYRAQGAWERLTLRRSRAHGNLELELEE